MVIIRKASTVFKWEKKGDFFQLRALKDLRPRMSIDWDIGIKECPPGQPKRTLNVNDTHGESLTRIRKGSIHFLTPNVYNAEWDMDTSPVIEVLMNPHKNNDIDCTAFKHTSKKMKLLFLNMAPNTTITVLGNTALRKFLREHLQSLADRNIKIFLSVQHSPHLMEPPVPLCYPYWFGRDPADTAQIIFAMAHPTASEAELSKAQYILSQSYVSEKEGKTGAEGLGRTLFRLLIEM